MREYPAYARAIAQHLVRGEKPLAIAVVLSNRWWGLLDHVPKICIRTEEWSPGRYEFSYLHGQHVVAYWGDCEDRPFGELLLELMAAAPRMLWAFDMAGTALSVDDPGEALTMAEWVGRLTDRKYHRDPEIKAARLRYTEAIASEATRELAEFERINQRSGIEAAVRWHAARAKWPELVRRRFGAQLQGESAQPA